MDLGHLTLKRGLNRNDNGEEILPVKEAKVRSCKHRFHRQTVHFTFHL